MRLRPAIVLLPVLVLLAGCAPEPAPTPTPSATSTPPPSPAPTPTATETPDSSEPGAKFTTAQLVALCTDRTRALAPEATYLSDMATTEWLADVSLWFVVIPKTLGDQDSVAVCAIGGNPDAPEFELEGESLPSGVAEIRDELLAGNGGGAE